MRAVVSIFSLSLPRIFTVFHLACMARSQAFYQLRSRRPSTPQVSTSVKPSAVAEPAPAEPAKKSKSTKAKKSKSAK